MQINAAIQLLPLSTVENRYDIVDNAILIIQQSGLHFKVCPFETVVEGNSQSVYQLIEKIQSEMLRNGCDELILNVKIHAGNRDLSFEDKLAKY